MSLTDPSVLHSPTETSQVFTLFSGFAAFINILGSPQFQDIRSLDVVRLVAIGACLGVAVAGLALLIGARFCKG